MYLPPAHFNLPCAKNLIKLQTVEIGSLVVDFLFDSDKCFVLIGGTSEEFSVESHVRSLRSRQSNFNVLGRGFSLSCFSIRWGVRNFSIFCVTAFTYLQSFDILNIILRQERVILFSISVDFSHLRHEVREGLRGFHGLGFSSGRSSCICWINIILQIRNLIGRGERLLDGRKHGSKGRRSDEGLGGCHDVSSFKVIGDGFFLGCVDFIESIIDEDEHLIVVLLRIGFLEFLQFLLFLLRCCRDFWVQSRFFQEILDDRLTVVVQVRILERELLSVHYAASIKIQQVRLFPSVGNVFCLICEIVIQEDASIFHGESMIEEC